METRSLERRNRFYEVFEPHCKWNTFETLDIDLKGFRTEQVKVQINHNRGMLLIHGERPLGATNKWTRFHKNIKLSEDSNLSEIRAKFSDGVLSIVVPKQVNEPVNDVVVAGTHGRSSGWGVELKMNNWGAMKAAAALAMAVVSVGVVIGSRSPPPPVQMNPVPVVHEAVIVERAVKEPDNQPKPGSNFRLK